MASLDELPLKYRAFVRTYRWRKIDPIPFAPLRKPLSDCRVAIVSTAGLTEPDDDPFDPSVRGGDWSFREIATTTNVSELVESHRSDAWDHTGVAEDRNLALPIGPLMSLAADGMIGSVNDRHLSFMGSLTAPTRLVQISAPEAAVALARDEVDVALLVPV